MCEELEQVYFNCPYCGLPLHFDREAVDSGPAMQIPALVFCDAEGGCNGKPIVVLVLLDGEVETHRVEGYFDTPETEAAG